MRILVGCVGLIVLSVSIAVAPARAAQSNADLANQAMQAYVDKQYGRSADLFMELIAKGEHDPGIYYNAACASALAGRKEQAFELLRGAIANGFGDAANLERDSDLESLHSDARWLPLVEGLEKAVKAREAFWNPPALSTPYRAVLTEDEKIVGLSRFWTEVKFNFANFALVPDLDWDALYVSYLPRVRAAKSTLDYYRVLSEMCARLHDGHTNVYVSKEMASEVYARPAVVTRLVEDHVLVVRVGEAARSLGVEVGQEVVAIDGVPVKEYAAERVRPYQSASTPQDLDARTYEYFLLGGSVSSPVALTLRTADGATIERKLPRLSPEDRAKQLPRREPMEFRMLPGNIAYVALNAFDDDTAAEGFEAAFDEISKSDALIIDVRDNGGGNSNVGYRVLACLTDAPFKTSAWRTRDYRPSFRAWGRGESWYEEAAGEVSPSGTRHYTKPVVVLTSARTYSAAEDFTVAFDAMKRGQIVGEPTGGSTGQPLFVSLPGGLQARICTKHDSYPDGREFVGVGVRPQITAHPTVAAVRAGRDTVLEAALAALGQAN